MSGRAEEQRRRKPDEHGKGRLRLSTPEVPGYYIRWVNDVGNRIHEVTVKDDFDYVSREEIGDFTGSDGKGNNDLGSKVRELVDKDESGPIYAYLMKKKIEWHEADRQKLEQTRVEKEAALKRGNDQIENQIGSLT